MTTKELLGKDQFAALLGIELLEAHEGRAKAKLEIKDEHLNGVKMAQGGAIFSLADFALAAAANSHGNIAVSINVSVSFLKAAGKEVLYAEAIEISRSAKLATYTVNVTNQKNEMIASLQGMVYRKKEMF